MFKLILTKLGLKKTYKIQSFTYFIPSPPPRSTGYREKQFDKLFFEFINRGYKILNVTSQSSNGDKQSGMWIIFIVQATSKQADLLNFEDSNIDITKSADKPSIEGLYYIDDKAVEND